MRVLTDKIIPALKEAGFIVQDVHSSINDVYVATDEKGVFDTLNFTVQDDASVTWDDFSHSTLIVDDFDKHEEMVKVFKELLPLRGDELQAWIKARAYQP